ncbi:TetR/AcrR family transcriptional regulator [Halovivax gelatinilyticus]|uniref:TetR/AcrR family transcriptional regulator n=1 Tax=Halovivax gelatinilyticus TaxID=2961597 RepID=UPI0020CA4ADE|nr:TetR/AcrR family transcriptional regulator [Halovivax gelatinilyticus]
MSEDADRDETTRAIMEGTYRALCEHGYPETTISKIADEFGRSRSLLYYHYEDKDELLTDFLRFLIDRVESDLDTEALDDPAEELTQSIDRFVPEPMDDDQLNFRQAYFEIRSQAPHKPTYRALIGETDALIIDHLADTIERGIEDGTFRAVDAEATASFLYSSMYGTMVRGVTLEEQSLIRRNRETLFDYVDRHLRS